MMKGRKQRARYLMLGWFKTNENILIVYYRISLQRSPYQWSCRQMTCARCSGWRWGCSICAGQSPCHWACPGAGPRPGPRPRARPGSGHGRPSHSRSQRSLRSQTSQGQRSLGLPRLTMLRVGIVEDVRIGQEDQRMEDGSGSGQVRDEDGSETGARTCADGNTFLTDSAACASPRCLVTVTRLHHQPRPGLSLVRTLRSSPLIGPRRHVPCPANTVRVTSHDGPGQDSGATSQTTPGPGHRHHSQLNSPLIGHYHTNKHSNWLIRSST